jgi:tRNA (guanine-N7-)-methyltransferase
MRLRNIKNADSIIASSPYIVTDPSTYKGKWNMLFNNNNPLHIEIGMGKGRFIKENALKYPNINFIGIEKYSSVLIRAIQKIDNIDINNLKLICIDALTIDNIFDKEIDTIYLNFSDPWPKDRHAKRRLTSDIFMHLYDYIFKCDHNIVLKTDNYNLYEYSKEQFIKHDYIIKVGEFDINSMPEDNIMTEYEEKFLSNGNTIYMINAFRNGDYEQKH